MNMEKRFTTTSFSLNPEPVPGATRAGGRENGFGRSLSKTSARGNVVLSEAKDLFDETVAWKRSFAFAQDDD
jgi:hypothetical protein